MRQYVALATDPPLFSMTTAEIRRFLIDQYIKAIFATTDPKERQAIIRDLADIPGALATVDLKVAEGVAGCAFVC